jgi:hypothetical protein
MTATSKADLSDGMQVESSDGKIIGDVAEVFRDVGVGESWGSVGAIPMSGAEAVDANEYAFDESMPGQGSDYFRVRTGNSTNLYVPLGVVAEIRDGVAVLAVESASIADMQWDIMPDFLNVASAPDSGADSTQA